MKVTLSIYTVLVAVTAFAVKPVTSDMISYADAAAALYEEAETNITQVISVPVVANKTQVIRVLKSRTSTASGATVEQVTLDPAVDKVAISDFAHKRADGTLTATLRYVCTKDVSSIKPTVYASNELAVGKDNFPAVNSANVTAPVYHAGTLTVENKEYPGYYEITVTIPSTGKDANCFFWLKLDPSVQ